MALIAATEQALAAGIAVARPGNKVGAVGQAVAAVARGAGYGLLADRGGHGIGRTMHEEPHVPNEARSWQGLKMRPGLVIAIEPMLLEGGSDNYLTDADGWRCAPLMAAVLHMLNTRLPSLSTARSID